MKYQTTKIQCQKGIDELGNVCDGCGGERTPLKTVDNAGNPTYWSGCDYCSIFTHGTKKEIWEMARYMVMVLGEKKYKRIDDYLEDRAGLEYWLNSETRGVVGRIEQITYLMGKDLKTPPKEKWLTTVLNTGYIPSEFRDDYGV